jgi:hypothetical protein
VTTCRMKLTRGGARLYFVDDVEVDEWTYRKGVAREAAEQRRVLKKQNGKRERSPGMYGDFADWRRETDPKTGLNGRYCPQLAKFKGDPNAVCKNRSELIDRGERLGYTVEKE